MSSISEEILADTNTIVNQLKQSFNDEYNNVKVLFDYYRSLVTNTENSIELYREYLAKNEELEKNIRNSHSDILTNDRKTYYETEGHNRLDLWYKFLRSIYYILVFMVVVSLFFTLRPLELWKKIIILIFVIFYPIIVKYILDLIYAKYSQFKKILPKNVYQNI